ncbi:MAG: hypothetical protein H7Y30_02895 [Pyrinomonadaceae bacterium]|nr:hypothetical protein [Pyrinomonadaceae bacterium]
MRKVFINLVIAIALVSCAMTEVSAQGKKKKAATPRTTTETEPRILSEADGAPTPNGGGEVMKAAEIYKTSLRQLLAAREAQAAQEGEQMDKLKALYKDGLISKRQLGQAELELIEARHKVEEVRKQLAATDQLVVESLAENDANSIAEFETTKSSGSSLKKVAYIRYRGHASFSVSDAGKIEKFYAAKFKRPLPVAALGQSDLHTRWGYDHRNALDVALHPDTKEGLALMNYLSSQGIPFMAFRRAVPGSATGPHIHIGNPSQKTTK